MKRASLLASLLCVILLGAGLHAQATFVVPKGFASVEGNGADPYIAWASVGGHVQHIYATSEIQRKTGLLLSMAFRRTNTIATLIKAGSLRATIALSHSPRAHGKTASVFAANEGADRKVVFNGWLHWPAAPKTTGPAPFVAKVPFRSYFAFARAKGASLVVDIQTSIRDATWPVDLVAPDVGARLKSNHRSATCLDSRGRQVTSVSFDPTQLVPGGSWAVVYAPCPANTAGLASIGFKGAGASWGSLRLPIDLTALGAPGCYWATDSAVFWPFRADALGNGRVPPLSLPRDASIRGLTFYDQSLLLDRRANSAGWLTIWSNKWSLGSGHRPAATWVWNWPDYYKSRTGQVEPYHGAVIQFTYK